MSNIDATRVMGVPGANATISLPIGTNPTVQMPAGGDAFRTQMGGVITCPVCKSSTPLLDPYCGDCGYLLASVAASDTVEIEPVEEEKSIAEVVDEQGRRYPLRLGPNTVGRQGTDIITADGTVSRVHAVIKVNSATDISVEDLGSSNGTKVGDVRLKANEPTIAIPGTSLRFGNWRVTLEADTSAVTAVAERTVLVASADAEKTVLGTVDESQDALLLEPLVAPSVEASPVLLLIARLKKLEGISDDIELTAGSHTFGRRSGNTLVLSDPYLSGKHAEISAASDGVYLTDLGSTNGTFVNGQRLGANVKQLLVAGDEVQLGQTRYVLEIMDSAPEELEISPLSETVEGQVE